MLAPDLSLILARTRMRPAVFPGLARVRSADSCGVRDALAADSLQKTAKTAKTASGLIDGAVSAPASRTRK
jgi:hypothetical protein